MRKSMDIASAFKDQAESLALSAAAKADLESKLRSTQVQLRVVGQPFLANVYFSLMHPSSSHRMPTSSSPVRWSQPRSMRKSLEPNCKRFKRLRVHKIVYWRELQARSMDYGEN